MTTIARSVFDAVRDLGVLGCTLPDICLQCSQYDRAVVVSAVHRLREMGMLSISREIGIGSVYRIAKGAKRPSDGRGRPKKAGAA